MQKVAFIIPPTVELLDLAGPVQFLRKQNFMGLRLNRNFINTMRNQSVHAGLASEKWPVTK